MDMISLLPDEVKAQILANLPHNTTKSQRSSGAGAGLTLPGGSCAHPGNLMLCLISFISSLISFVFNAVQRL